ncbi:hypothetical protein EJ07DRAFT_184173 [Lizonia empirigonia]|nr:hypothetical protein EJ07DRAFT_184173 [Lizonia empirigonia]
MRSPMMMKTQASKRSSHNPYLNHDDDKPSANPFLDEKEKALSTKDDQSQLSPMFIDYLRKKTAAVDLEKIDTASDTNDKYRGAKIAQTISPIDGKTIGCDRLHTFDTFIDQRRISGDAGQDKRVGHGWQVARALRRVLSSKGRGTKKARKHDDALPVPQGLAA